MKYPKMMRSIAPWLLVALAMEERLIDKNIREDKSCKCGQRFIPKRMGHYLCDECFEKQTGQTK